LLDWLSVSRRTTKDSEIHELREAIKAITRDHFSVSDTVPMRSAGNFEAGEKFEHLGGEIKWTTRTAAALNQWDEEGRCVGWVNVTFRGSTGIGKLDADRAVSLCSSLKDLGFDQCRRVDCTIDLFDDEVLSVFLIREHLIQGSWRIPRRDVNSFRFHGALVENQAAPTPATLYLSSKTAETQVVVYDKAAQLEREGGWIRFEMKAKRDQAADVYQALLEASDASAEHGHALIHVDSVITSAVRNAADIRDVTRFPTYPVLPRNWMRSPKAQLPAELAPVFMQVAPLDVASIKVAGGFAAQVRHAIKSTGKTTWKLCILTKANGTSPGPVALEMGFPHYERIGSDDFMEMAQQSDRSIAELEQAELACINEFIELKGFDVRATGSDRTELRSEAMKGLVKGL
jgi:hypothetical protein